MIRRALLGKPAVLSPRQHAGDGRGSTALMLLAALAFGLAVWTVALVSSVGWAACWRVAGR